MGDLYDQLAAYYHEFFPAREGQLSLLTARAGIPPVRVLDVGSGTGEYVAALVGAGYEVTGLELHAAMQAQALARHPELAANLLTGDMLEIEELCTGPYNLAYCIGGGIAHLKSDAEVASVIKAMWEITRPDGAVVLQLANFDRVLKHGERIQIASDRRVSERDTPPGLVFDLPLMEQTAATGEALKLERQYLLRRAADLEDPDNQPDKIVFHTKLTVDGTLYEYFAPMLILTYERLRYCLPREADRVWYGGFLKEDWSEEAPATVIVLY
ncbi:class I SAM-dependent methyltransferase [bacterium]|nr:class I SAM-dependent methyltransferase [bacterium]